MLIFFGFRVVICKLGGFLVLFCWFVLKFEEVCYGFILILIQCLKLILSEENLVLLLIVHSRNFEEFF